MAGIFEKLRRLQRLLDDAEQIPDPAFLHSLRSQFQSLEQRVNLLEAYLQSDGKGADRPAANLEPVQSALAQLGASIQSTMQMLQGMQSSIKRSEESMKGLRERLDRLERSVQALSIKAA